MMRLSILSKPLGLTMESTCVTIISEQQDCIIPKVTWKIIPILSSMHKAERGSSLHFEHLLLLQVSAVFPDSLWNPSWTTTPIPQEGPSWTSTGFYDNTSQVIWVSTCWNESVWRVSIISDMSSHPEARIQHSIVITSTASQPYSRSSSPASAIYWMTLGTLNGLPPSLNEDNDSTKVSRDFWELNESAYKEF